ncbi:Platelet-derived growth factor subunit B [Ooceraea biroi]|uniref:Platelet-derived growth factor subunit B n=1 Tax=Ooceraea biroi TaxID=2015173 RepID=A0A026W4U7_OOCBI|nr:Platelet-derived growth factor subunit B [Ooceraea biroi]
MYVNNESAAYLRCLSVKISIFAIICILGTFILGQVKTQDFHDDIIYPGSDNSRVRNNPTVQSAEDGDTQIPVDLANRLNAMESSDEFLQLLQGVPHADTSSFMLNSTFGGDERTSAIVPTPANCIPELQPVSLKLDDDPSTMIFPSCTRIPRCGGCCSTSLLSCQPTATEIRNFMVIVASVKELGYKGRQIVPLEEHIKCKCDCKIKAKDCTEKQHYEPHNCRCACSNVDEEQKCRKESDIKIWNGDLCSCSCRTIEECSTGYFFNHNTCRCGPINRPVNRFVPTKGSNYNFGNRQPENVPPVIIPLDPSDPRRKHKEDPESRDSVLSCPWCIRN